MYLETYSNARTGVGKEKFFSSTEEAIRMVSFNCKNRQFFLDIT